MEDRGEQKPLRSSSNKAKDLKDTYLKNEGRPDARNIDIENENMEEDIKKEKKKQESAETDVITEETEELRKKVEELQEEKEKWEEQFKRKAAEFENLRSRSIKEKQQMLEFANEKMLFKFLELLDDINNAVAAGEQTEDFEALLKGLEMIRQKAEKLFGEEGVKQMEDPVGKEFDVDYHDAMMHTPHEEIPEGNVIQVLQPGYMLNGKVLRHARVITSAGNSKD